MEELVDNIIKCDFDNIPFSTFPIDERFGLVVTKNDVPYEFLIHIKTDNDKLLCLGSGALNPPIRDQFINKPRFNRHSWGFKESTIFYNDPTRYLDKSLQGGWGIGTPDDWFLENIKDIIIRVANFFNFNNENILFYGSSLGGFQSILLSILVKDSTALADVPQLTFENDRYWDYVKKILFPEFSDEYIYENFKHRLNVLDLMKKEKYIPNLVMVFGAGERDRTEHYIPFFKQLNKLTEFQTSNKNHIKIIINPIDRHLFLDEDDTLYLIKRVFDNKV